MNGSHSNHELMAFSTVYISTELLVLFLYVFEFLYFFLLFEEYKLIEYHAVDSVVLYGVVEDSPA